MKPSLFPKISIKISIKNSIKILISDIKISIFNLTWEEWDKRKKMPRGGGRITWGSATCITCIWGNVVYMSHYVKEFNQYVHVIQCQDSFDAE